MFPLDFITNFLKAEIQVLICLSSDFQFPRYGTSPMAQTAENLSAMQETQGRTLGWEDPLEKGMETHSSILVWTIPWTREPGGPQSMGVTKSQTRQRN